jgi:hypothetical protein
LNARALMGSPPREWELSDAAIRILLFSCR